MSLPNFDEVFMAAKEEVLYEFRREQIENIKKQIRQDIKNKRWWHRFIPFTIKIERRK